MLIRNMLTGDRHVIFERAKALAELMYPALKVDIKKINDELEAIGRYEYAKVVARRENCAVEGCLIARTAPNLWAQRNHAAIVLWYSDLPGGGVALLRDFRQWVQSSRKIRLAGFAHDSEYMAPEMLKLVERVGFKEHGGSYMLYN